MLTVGVEIIVSDVRASSSGSVQPWMTKQTGPRVLVDEEQTKTVVIILESPKRDYHPFPAWGHKSLTGEDYLPIFAQ